MFDRAMLIRDWLCKGGISKGVTDGQLDDTILEQGKSYVNEMCSIDASQIDVDILSALEDLEHLKLVEQYEVKDDQEAQDSIKQLWNDAFQ